MARCEGDAVRELRDGPVPPNRVSSRALLPLLSSRFLSAPASLERLTRACIVSVLSTRRDIDLVIQSDSMDRQNKVTVLHTLASVLRRANLAESIQVIAKAKVPIVKFVSAFGQYTFRPLKPLQRLTRLVNSRPPGRLPIDISLNQLNGISAGKIVNSYIAALPALKPLVLVIKAFLSQRGMNEVYSGGLGSYSVICLVVSFLQVSRASFSSRSRHEQLADLVALPPDPPQDPSRRD